MVEEDDELEQEDADEEDVDEEKNAESETNSEIWLIFLDQVSEVTRISWDKLWEMNIYEFFTYLVYAKNKI